MSHKYLIKSGGIEYRSSSDNASGSMSNFFVISFELIPNILLCFLHLHNTSGLSTLVKNCVGFLYEYPN